MLLGSYNRKTLFRYFRHNYQADVWDLQYIYGTKSSKNIFRYLNKKLECDSQNCMSLESNYPRTIFTKSGMWSQWNYLINEHSLLFLTNMVRFSFNSINLTEEYFQLFLTYIIWNSNSNRKRQGFPQLTLPIKLVTQTGTLYVQLYCLHLNV